MIKRLLVLLVAVGLIAAGGLYYAVAVPAKNFGKEVFVDIPSGTGSSKMAAMLRQAGVVPSEWQFLLARALERNVRLQAGEYRFDRPLSPLEVVRKIARGDIFYYELRVPEGSNIFDIATAAEKTGFLSREAFLSAARDPALIRDIAPTAPSLEGFLFPSTYRITRHTTPRQICRQMTTEFRKAWARAGGPKEDANRIVTLASLIEKETAVPDERTTVASVYSNRLRLGMKLDCDPTVIYAAMLSNRYRGTIYRSDLDNPHPYNTYQMTGLPPGAIANPGLESLKAALHPGQTNYLYFVARPDGSGGHTFSDTIGRHNAAVQAYRNGLAR